jgi:hypothetical protein
VRAPHGLGAAQGSATAPARICPLAYQAVYEKPSMQTSTADRCDAVIEVAEAAGAGAFLGLDVDTEMVRPGWSPFPVRKGYEEG